MTTFLLDGRLMEFIRLRSLIFDRRSNHPLVFLFSPAVFDSRVGEDLASVESGPAHRT